MENILLATSQMEAQHPAVGNQSSNQTITSFKLDKFPTAGLQFSEKKNWDSMGQGLIWAAYKGHLLEQHWKNRIRELDLQAVHMRRLWKSKWERTKHQLIQRLQTHLISLHVLALAVRDRLHVGRQQLCLRLEMHHPRFSAGWGIFMWNGGIRSPRSSRVQGFIRPTSGSTPR